MQATHPDPDARWIWPRPNYNAQNSYAGFRHDFILAKLPSAAPLVINQGYRLHINGQYVCRGPETRPFDPAGGERCTAA